MKSVAKLVSDPRLKQKLKDMVGIGTEATRANIINGLLTRGYLIKKGRAVRASDAAATLIDAVPAAIADPGTTAVWEQALDMIEAGELTYEVFIDKQSAWIAQIIAQYQGTALSIKVPQGPACPQCGSAMSQRTRSEEHTSELQSIMRMSYAVFCLKKKNKLESSLTKTNEHTYVT